MEESGIGNSGIKHLVAPDSGPLDKAYGVDWEDLIDLLDGLLNIDKKIPYGSLAVANSILNADIAAGAAIAKSKLAALAIVNADIDAAAAILESKLALNYPTHVRQHSLGGAVLDHSDVSIATPTNGQILKYNSTSGKWENQAEAGGGGLTPDVFSGTYVHQNNTNEQTMLEITPGAIVGAFEFYFDVDALVNDAVLKVYSKIDGTNYKELTDLRLTLDSTRRSGGIVMDGVMFNTMVKFTLQSATAEGATRNIPYRYYTETY